MTIDRKGNLLEAFEQTLTDDFDRSLVEYEQKSK
jgi:hypothetical protein